MLRFTLFRIPIAAHGSFFLVAAVLGLIRTTNPWYIAVWIGIVFFSIMIHELGHAFTARQFGATVAIELNGIGGLTRWSVPSPGLLPGRRALVAASGSAVGVVFGIAAWLIATQFAPFSGLVGFTVVTLVNVNLFWGLINWAPIRPLDGGHLVNALLEKVAPRRKETIARAVFILTAAAGLGWALVNRQLIIAVIAGFLLFSELNIRRPVEARAPIPPLSYDDEDQAAERSTDADAEREDPSQ